MAGFGQEIPEWGPVFVQDEISRIEVIIDPDSLAFILNPDSVWSNHEYPATVIFSNSLVQDTLQLSGFRLRGNTSRLAEKKSFKISFTAFNQGRKYYGLEELNLNGQHNDVSIMRAKLCWDIYLNSGLPASRSGYCELFINNEYKGLYLNTEHIDEQFVKHRFGNSSGNLYKCLYPADLAYLGNNPDNYKLEASGRRVYDLQNNLYLDNYSDLAELANVLNAPPNNNFVCDLTAIFNVDAYLRIAALDILLGNWDGYIYNKNNFYLYKNPVTSQFEFIPYDLDNTLGIDWMGEDWTERDPYQWQHPTEDRPLFERLMGEEEFRNAFSYYLNEFAVTYFESGILLQEADTLRALLEDALPYDPYYPLDYGFTLQDFSMAISSAWGGHIEYGIAEFTQSRLTSLYNILENYESIAYPGFVRDNGPLVSEQTVSFFAYVPFNGDTPVWLETSYDGNTWELQEMNDDGIFPDELAGDELFGLSVFPDFSNERLRYRIRYGNGESTFPCSPKTLWLKKATINLVINELMSNNTGFFTDEFGESDDWFELYNAHNSAVNLFSFTASDVVNEPGRWKMPALTLNPGEFALIWADGDEEQGILHAPFSLNSQGESLYLWMRQSDAYRHVDVSHFGSFPANYSFGRSSDGDPEWILFNEPTPGSPNGITGITEGLSELLVAYPNPSESGLFSLNIPSEGVVYTAQGHLITRIAMNNMIDLRKEAAGLYIFREVGGRYVRIMKK
jgi:hypothetical protein